VSAERIIKTEKVFPAEDHNKRVGWVKVAERDGSPFVAIDVVTATVLGEEGAKFGHWNWDDEGRISLPTPFQEGLGQVAAFAALISRERSRLEEFNLHYVPEGMNYPHYTPRAEDLLDRGTGDNRDMQDVEKLWAEGSAELLDTLRSVLANLKFDDAYTVMYYLINGAIGVDSPYESVLKYVRPEVLLLPDPAMAGQTLKELEAMKGIRSALGGAIINDVNMRGRITRFINDTPIEEVPARFVESRERAAAFERDVSQGADALTIQRLAYVPVGHGRKGRTWPYMDASVADPGKAYGLELRDLKDRKIDRAVDEIDREVEELEARQVLAAGAIQRFELLSQLERNASITVSN
jgi:hypothetical protein